MKLTCLQVTRRLSKLLGSQDDSDQTGTQPTNELVKTLTYQHTALGGGLTPGSPKQPKRNSLINMKGQMKVKLKVVLYCRVLAMSLMQSFNYRHLPVILHR